MVGIRRLLSISPFDATYQNRMGAGTDVAEAASRGARVVPAERAQGRDIVDAVRLGEVDALIRVVQIPTDLKSEALPESPRFR